MKMVSTCNFQIKKKDQLNSGWTKNFLMVAQDIYIERERAREVKFISNFRFGNFLLMFCDIRLTWWVFAKCTL